MPINQETFNSNLYDLLKTRGLNPIPMDSKGQNLPVPQEADVFKVQFEDGDAWITIDDARQLTVYYNDELLESGQSEEFSNLLKHLKNWAQRRQLGFELVNRDHLASDMAKREHMKKKEQLGEAYHPMGKKASYSDNIPAVKIILQHTRPIEEGEQRYRNIAKIFVENIEGERFLLPTTRPGIARVYARHVAEGGTPYDDRGTHITTLVEEYTKMAGFVRATKNGQFNESAQRLVNEGINHYMSLRETLSRMISRRGYNKYFESYTPVLNEESEDANNLNELFVQETLDPRIESVLPILKKLSKNINEMNVVKELDEWAQSITEIEDETTKTLAEPADKMLDEEKPELYFVTKKDSNHVVGTWDGQHFKPFDRSKYPSGTMDMVPNDCMIDKADGPVSDKDISMAKALGEGTNITYFYIKVDGKPKFKSRNKVTAEKYLKDMMNDPNFKNKKVELEVKDEFQGSMEENLDEINLGKTGKALAATAGLAAAGIGAEHQMKMPSLAQIEADPNYAYMYTQNLANDPKYREAIQTYITTRDEEMASPGSYRPSHLKNLSGNVTDQQIRVWTDTLDQYKAKQPTMWNKIKNKIKGYLANPMGKVNEAPGEETLAHNQSTEKSNLKAFDLDEGFSPSQEVADQIIDSLGGDKQLTINDVYRAVEEYQSMMDNPHKIDIDDVVQIVIDRMNIGELDEDLNANQKRAGQLGPTEPVGKNEKNLRGKLVGASESVEMERLKTLSGIK